MIAKQLKFLIHSKKDNLRHTVVTHAIKKNINRNTNKLLADIQAITNNELLYHFCHLKGLEANIKVNINYH